jgi:3-phosphoshikimate 1-carboxyvinyltransferase
MVGATILPKSGITIKGLSLNPTRCGIIPLLRKMGARVRVVRKRAGFEPSGDVTVESAKTKGVVIGAGMIPGIIDEIPVIAVLAALSKGRTVIKGIGELRVKETDRVESMLYNLKAMGAEVRIENDSIIIEGMASLRGAQLKSYGDHRTAMAMTIAAMAADGPSRLDDPDCVTKSFPQFFDVLREIAR